MALEYELIAEVVLLSELYFRVDMWWLCRGYGVRWA
jgi:hypothetical protein